MAIRFPCFFASPSWFFTETAPYKSKIITLWRPRLTRWCENTKPTKFWARQGNCTLVILVNAKWSTTTNLYRWERSRMVHDKTGHGLMITLVSLYQTTVKWYSAKQIIKLREYNSMQWLQGQGYTFYVLPIQNCKLKELRYKQHYNLVVTNCVQALPNYFRSN